MRKGKRFSIFFIAFFLTVLFSVIFFGGVYEFEEKTPQQVKKGSSFKNLKNIMISWQEIITELASDLRGNLKIKLHTDGVKSYNNQSCLTYHSEDYSIAIPNLEYEIPPYGNLRFLFNEFNSDANCMKLSRDQCQSNQLALDICFEYDGIEIKGYDSSIIAPDFDIENASIKIILGFDFVGGDLSYTVDHFEFDYNIKAINSIFSVVAQFLISAFSKDVEGIVEDELRKSLILTRLIKDKFLEIIKDQPGLKRANIREINFEKDEIIVSYNNNVD